MGEYVWTTYTIGGTVTAEHIRELVQHVMNYPDQGGGGDFADGLDALKEAVKAGTALVIATSLNFGNDEALDDFLVEAGLPFSAAWSAQPGQFDAGIRYWNPGMDGVDESGGDDDGEPVIALRELRSELAAGKTLADIIAGMEPASGDAVPPLALAEGALEAALEDA